MTNLIHIPRTSTQPWRVSRAALERAAVLFLLGVHASLLAYSATTHSPTNLEPAFLASGISHWQFGRFDLYRVNPPLVRMVAALPVLAVGCETDWSSYAVGNIGTRSEFPVGEDFIRANGRASLPLFVYARWACIPFNLIGSYFAYRWARELYGGGAGFVAMVLYVFEPNLLAHGELITPDGACCAFGILAGYTFWRWLRQPTWIRALLAGAALGLAQLSKTSWLILFALWPFLWLAWHLMQFRFAQPLRQIPDRTELVPSCFTTNRIRSTSPQLAMMLILAVYIINLGYGFDGIGTPLKDLRFFSRTLTGLDKSGESGNRFRGLWVGEIPLPVPREYILGIDTQKRDFESFPQKSYLRGVWQDTGWWYYYLYGCLVKVPCGTLALLLASAIHHPLVRHPSGSVRDNLVLLSPAIFLFVLVSSQTAFSIHLRYVFPSLALCLVFASRASSFVTHRLSLTGSLVAISIGYSLISTLLVYPHHLAYFNDFVGGPTHGHEHLLGSSCDWGQDLLFIDALVDGQFGEEDCVYVGTSPFRAADILTNVRSRATDCATVMLVSRNVVAGDTRSVAGVDRRVRSALLNLQRTPASDVNIYPTELATTCKLILPRSTGANHVPARRWSQP